MLSRIKPSKLFAMASPLMKECQYTDHGNSKTHSNPQDNIIGLKENGEPDWNKEINYYDEEAPRI